MLQALAKAVGMDLEVTMDRFCHDKDFLLESLQDFLQDKTFAQLDLAWKESDQEGLIAAVHTLKGLSGNLGLDALALASAQLLAHLRDKGAEGAQALYEAVCAQYDTAVTAIQENKA